MPKMKQLVKHGKVEAPLFLAKYAKKKAVQLQPPTVGAIATHKAVPPPVPAVRITPVVAVKVPGAPVKLPALVPSAIVNRGAVQQDRLIDAKQGIKAGGAAKQAVYRNEIKTVKQQRIAARGPLVRKNPPPPTINYKHGKKVITSAFQQTRFHTPFQKNVNIRRLTGIY